MRCLFCKQNSEASVSREHVIPESLGNTTLILEPGIVCDKCNNYFARKVEKPFLDSTFIKQLRFEQLVPGKRGRSPQLQVSVGGYPATLEPPTKRLPQFLRFEDQRSCYAALLSPSLIATNVNAAVPPTPKQTSRFLAMIALEWMASVLEPHDGGLDYLVEEANLDSLRGHARFGTPRFWPCSVRRVYSADTRWIEEGKPVQRVWEVAGVELDSGDSAVVCCLFGIEMAIQLGVPDVSEYQRWLIQHGGASPLYSGQFEPGLNARLGRFQRDARDTAITFQPVGR